MSQITTSAENKVPCDTCDGTGIIAVHSLHGVQEQDCPVCDCSGVVDAD